MSIRKSMFKWLDDLVEGDVAFSPGVGGEA